MVPESQADTDTPSLKDDILSAHRDLRSIKPGPNADLKHPKGWTPGFDGNENEGMLTVGPVHKDPEWDALLIEWDFDPDLFYIVDDTIDFRVWEQGMKDKDGEPIKQKLYYYRAKIARRSELTFVDYEELIRSIKSRRPRKSSPRYTGDGSAILNLADWQTGNRAGGGTPALIDRVMNLIDDYEHRVKLLRKMGYDIGTCVIAGLGDLLENCGNDWYAMQDFSVDLDLRSQAAVVRYLLDKIIDRLSGLFADVWVITVPGNHGEKRREGKAYTTWGDNYDNEVFDQVAFAFAKNPDRYSHVKFHVPEDEMTQAFAVPGGLTIGWLHGHQAAKVRGANPAEKIKEWWRMQSHGRTQIGLADILVNGHWHHFHAVEQGTADEGFRLQLQCPALDGGSPWWEHRRAEFTTAGTLTFVVVDSQWSALEIL